MNEIIVELLNKYSKDGTININVFEFSDAIQAACKAQREACVRIYNKHYGDSEHYDECCGLEIFTAEIRKEDYE